ncbi:hypothetical protein MPSEU_000588300 [Mayamaea pseudoterrestris]|nr:hypothetical protein MPSEU_000588300 [Mayamaea pseudoterrestris]
MTEKRDPDAPVEDDIPMATGTPIEHEEQAAAAASTKAHSGTTTTTTYTIPPPTPYQGPVLRSLGRTHSSTSKTSLTTLLLIISHPCSITCPYCHAQTRTLPRNSPDACTIVIFVVLLIVFWPICWLPFVLPDCQKTEHQCASCMRHVGTTESCSG